VQAGAVHAVIIRTGIVVVEDAHRQKYTVATLAEIIGARNPVIAYLRCAHAVTVDAQVIGAGVVISTVARHELADAPHAGIIGAQVVVIADDVGVYAHASLLAKVFSTGVVVIALEGMRAAARAEVIGAGVVIRAAQGDVSRIAARCQVGGEDVVSSQRNIIPCDIGPLCMAPGGYLSEIGAVI